MGYMIRYETLEKLSVGRPVDRLEFIESRCRDKVVLDVGCFDETALQKRDTDYWLHGRLAKVARRVVGVDNSSKIPDAGLRTSDRSLIYRGDGINIDPRILHGEPFDVIVAGEFIEHIESPLTFFRNVKSVFEGKEFLFSTPNGACFANTLMGAVGREVQHHDHIHNFSFKILNTLCMRAQFADWTIIPYHFFATEMILGSQGARKLFVQGVEKSIRVVERAFPLLSFGYVVRAKL
ncbi:MAG: methyltransferase domain-containing protein [Proteobacteria bacterium]|nr:methyltransferase domain-containing protein [Pseudomonadota bacterium]